MAIPEQKVKLGVRVFYLILLLLPAVVNKRAVAIASSVAVVLPMRHPLPPSTLRHHCLCCADHHRCLHCCHVAIAPSIAIVIALPLQFHCRCTFHCHCHQANHCRHHHCCCRCLHCRCIAFVPSIAIIVLLTIATIAAAVPIMPSIAIAVIDIM